MKHIRYALVASVLLFAAPLVASANVSHSPQAPTDPQPFTFSCSPYGAPFVDGNFYKPSENGTCTFTLPTSGQQVEFAIFEGTPGNSTFIDSDAGYSDVYTNVQVGPEDFNPPFTQGQDYFAAEFTYQNNTQLNDAINYLTSGGTPPNSITFNIASWKYGDAPVLDTNAPTVVINTPVNGSTYQTGSTVYAMASTSDDVGVVSTAYVLNGTTIDASQPLPLTVGSSTLVVSAADAAGNVGYATSTFGVQAPPPPPSDHTPPVITITSPINQGLYAKTDKVFVTATVTDQSAIATTTYWFNGVKINPAIQLPLSNAPVVSKVSVSSSDIYGNTATSTVTIFVVKSTNSCLIDIITVLTQITQDKTLPSKPTILNLIADCTALLKGLHHY